MVAEGYFNRPEANADAFRDGWFYTGNVGRFDEAGYLYLIDRVKDMILSGGLNIYCREVEQAIESLPALREVAVVAGPDAAYGECVVAYVARRPGLEVTPDEVIAHCREQIASYKKPKHVFIIDQLPRNVSGQGIEGRAARASRSGYLRRMNLLALLFRTSPGVVVLALGAGVVNGACHAGLLALINRC